MKTVFQFHITLRDVKPRVWRRVLVAGSYSFWDLHVAIQDAMGWTDSHLHMFHVADRKTGEKRLFGIPDDEGMGPESLPGWSHRIRDYFTLESPNARYDYDFAVSDPGHRGREPWRAASGDTEKLHRVP